MNKFPLLLIFLMNFLIGSNVCRAENRVALVIGNSSYVQAPLNNPINDANDITTILRTAGFSVTILTNARRRALIENIQEFTRKLHQPGSVGLFYFAGHGIEVDGRNYLLPIDANITTEADVPFEAVDAGRVLAGMEHAKNNLNLIILDACRDNPFKRSFRSTTRGLARISAPAGSLVMYATQPGNVAKDGIGRNGVFTEYFLNALENKKLKVEEVFKRTAQGVYAATSQSQLPWIEGVVLGDFYFFPPIEGQIPKIPTPPAQMPIVTLDRERYGVYLVNRCGSITDTSTGLEWYVGPDQTLTWDESKKWVSSLRACGGRWRMPTVHEIKTLYNPTYTAGTGYSSGNHHWPAHIHPVFSKIGQGSWVWGNKLVGSKKARSFNLNQGVATSYARDNSKYTTRVFAVR